ncbi:pyridoxamine 5'-phosphate oxidase family protein [Candidatus Bathyarchaeota archaeon]|nr:pyridoxamine 5'-phosphate oxidase family protein [Candidatus Bathyarchaeota archaeon]
MVDESVFLSENKLMTLASLSPNGGPRAVPVAFMYDKGKFYVSSGRQTRKVRNIARDSRVAFAVEDSTRTKAVVGKGTAKVIPASGSPELLRKLITHLVGSLEHPYAKIMLGSDRVVVEITPTSMKSWDLPPTG